MNIRELRIGNYMTYGFENSLVEWDLIKQDEAGLEYYKPIPLTKEWLLSFGFKQTYKDHDSYFSYKNFTVCIRDASRYNTKYYFSVTVYNGERKSSRSVGDEGLRVKKKKYVHHLQNLFFEIRGEELRQINKKPIEYSETLNKIEEYKNKIKELKIRIYRYEKS